MTDKYRLIRQINGALDMHGNLLTLDDLTELANKRQVELFMRGNTLCAAEILGYPRKVVCNCIVAAGDLADVMALEPEVEQFALRNGADFMVTHGRRAWARVGARTGWRERSIEFVKHLPGGGQ